MVRRLAYWGPALSVMAGIAYFSHRPEWPEVAQGSPDWLLHGGAYALLAWALHFGCAQRVAPARAALGCIGLAVAVASLYGVTDELHQAFVPLRHPSVADWLADTVGAVLAGAVLYLASFAGPGGVWED